MAHISLLNANPASACVNCKSDSPCSATVDPLSKIALITSFALNGEVHTKAGCVIRGIGLIVGWNFLTGEQLASSEILPNDHCHCWTGELW